MRVTNVGYVTESWEKDGFQSPICGSQTITELFADADKFCFNPLYAGHKLPGQQKRKPSDGVSIPYMRVTNEKWCNVPKTPIIRVSIPYMRVTNAECGVYRDGAYVSIPYMRVTNLLVARAIEDPLLFQSPICGSQTKNQTLFAGGLAVSIPYMRVTN